MFSRALGLAADVHAKGLREGTRHACHRINEAFYEWKYGIRTSGVISPSEMGFTNPDIIEYTPVTYHNFRTVMSRLALNRHRDVFLDYGCGMGRAVILAAAYPFRQVVGIEISANLAQIARENLARVRDRLVCENVQIVATDATEFKEISDVTVIFIYNPFCGSILGRVIANIRESLQAHPRDLTIVVSNFGDFEAQVRDASWIVMSESFRLYPRVSFAIYRCQPSKA